MEELLASSGIFPKSRMELEGFRWSEVTEDVRAFHQDVCRVTGKTLDKNVYILILDFEDYKQTRKPNHKNCCVVCEFAYYQIYGAYFYKKNDWFRSSFTPHYLKFLTKETYINFVLNGFKDKPFVKDNLYEFISVSEMDIKWNELDIPNLTEHTNWDWDLVLDGYTDDINSDVWGNIIVGNEQKNEAFVVRQEELAHKLVFSPKDDYKVRQRNKESKSKKLKRIKDGREPLKMWSEE